LRQKKTKTKWEFLVRRPGKKVQEKLLVCASLCIQCRSNSLFQKERSNGGVNPPFYSVALNTVSENRPLGSTAMERMRQSVEPGDGPITASLSTVTESSARKNVRLLTTRSACYSFSFSPFFFLPFRNRPVEHVRFETPPPLQETDSAVECSYANGDNTHTHTHTQRRTL